MEVHCPESIGIAATLDPRRHQTAPELVVPAPAPAAAQAPAAAPVPAIADQPTQSPAAVSIADAVTADIPPASGPTELKEKHFTIRYGDIGCSYRSLFGDYLMGAKKLVVEDPYIRRDNQIRNLLQLCELAVEAGTIKDITLVTTAENPAQQAEAEKKLDEIKETLADCDVAFTYRFADKIPDREIRTDTGWRIQIDRGLEIYQGPLSNLKIGATNYDLRPCMETKVTIFRTK